MNVMLICIGGVSTNVLAFKLQKYADEQKYSDHFYARRVYDYHEYLSETDLILLAPQANASKHTIVTTAQKHNIQVFMLDETAFSRSDIKSIYSLLLQSREIKTQILQAKRFLSCQDFFGVIIDTLLSCLPVYVFAFLCQWLYSITNEQLWQLLWQITGGVFGIYLIFSTGYHYGKRIRRASLQCAFVSLISTILLLPVNNTLSDQYMTFFRVSNAYIPLASFGIDKCLYLFPLALASAILYSALNYSITYVKEKNLHHMSLVHFNIKQFFYTSLTLIVFFFFRLCAEFLL